MTNPTPTSGAADLPEALRLADFLQGPFALDWTNEAAAELLRLHALTEQQQRELIKESHRTAEQKLRADQMTTQHAHQAALNTEARAQLAAARAAQAISAEQAGVPAQPVHVQNSPENEHVADDVSKSERESNMTAQPGQEGELLQLAKAYKVLDRATRAAPQPETADAVKRRELVTNWFAENWAIEKAFGLLDDYDAAQREVKP